MCVCVCKHIYVSDINVNNLTVGKPSANITHPVEDRFARKDYTRLYKIDNKHSFKSDRDNNN